MVKAEVSESLHRPLDINALMVTLLLE